MILSDNSWSIACHILLWTGTMLAFFYCLGKHSLSRQFLKRITSGFGIEEAHIFIKRIVISLCTLTLLGSNDFIIFTTSPGKISKVDNLSSVTKLVFTGIKLWKIFINVLLNSSTFSWAFLPENMPEFWPIETFNRAVN